MNLLVRLLPDFDTVRGRLAYLLTFVILIALATGWLPFLQWRFGTPAWLEYGFAESYSGLTGVTHTGIRWMDSEQLDMAFSPENATATRVVWGYFIPNTMVSLLISLIAGLVSSFVFEPLFKPQGCTNEKCRCIDHVMCSDKNCTCTEHKTYGWATEPESENDGVHNDAESSATTQPAIHQAWTPPPANQDMNARN